MSSEGTVSCTRKVKFCAGHRVMGHENKCATPHGHNYIVEVTAEAPKLDEIGRIIDFSLLKEKFGGWIEEKWDHTFLIWERDSELIAALEKITSTKPPFIAPFNPTAEEMAKYLLHTVAPELLRGSGVVVRRIIVHETENCYAEASFAP